MFVFTIHEVLRRNG